MLELRNFNSRMEENIGYFDTFLFEADDLFIFIEEFDCGLFTETKTKIFDKNKKLIAIGLNSGECAAYGIKDTKSFDVPREHKQIIEEVNVKMRAFRSYLYVL